MANNFTINPLGGFNPGQALTGLGQQIKQSGIEEQQAQQRQQQMQMQEQQMQQMFEQRNAEKIATLGAAKAFESKKAETNWGLDWVRATPERKAELLQEAMNNPLIDIDEDDVDIEGKQADLAVNHMLYNHLGKDAYSDLGLGGGEQPDKGFTLSQGQQRFDAQGNVIAGVAPKVAKTTEQVAIPEVLLDGLSPDLATKASAAYRAAGGGKDGMSAYQKQVDKGTEQEKRLASPAILNANFPRASQAEMAQLQGTMDAARTTETGLKAAGKVREEQKRLVKAKGFQTRAIELLSSIIDSPDIGDVTGSLEGAYDFRPFSDDESSLIADIEEAGNILTADNLSLMSGVLSESDIKILKNLAGGGLIRTRSTDRFKKDVTKLRDKLSSAMVVTADERAGRQGSTGNSGVPEGNTVNWADL